MNKQKGLIFGIKYANGLYDPFVQTRKRYLLNEDVNLNINSLGPPHENVKPYVNTFIDHWAKYGVKGHFTPMVMPNGTILPGYAKILDAFRQPCKQILGARIPEETAVFPAQSVACSILYRWLLEVMREETDRTVVLYQTSAFPADKSIIEQLTDTVNICSTNSERFKHVAIPENSDGIIYEEKLIELMKDHEKSLALVVLGDGGVSWKTGQILNLKRIGNYAKKLGAKFMVNLAHAIGTTRLELHDWNVSVAVCCLYKNLSASAGGASLLFIHEDEFDNLEMLGISGWFGSEDPIGALQGKPMVLKKNAQRMEVSNPCVITLLPAYAALEEFVKHDHELIYEKSKGLLDYFDELMNAVQENFDTPIRIITPKDQRSMEIVFATKDPATTKKLHEYISEKIDGEEIICDMRDGDRIRVGMFALVTNFPDLCKIFNRIWDFFDTQ